MKIDINNLKLKLVTYFKERLDQVVVIIILFVAIANAIFVSAVFYLATLSPGNLDIGSRDYKYVRIKVNQEVLERLDQRKDVDSEIVSEIEKVKDPFK
jgi:hypothetical protein